MRQIIDTLFKVLQKVMFSLLLSNMAKGIPPTKFPLLYSLKTPPAVAPTNNNIVKVMKIVLEDTDEQQKQNVSIKDPKEKLIRFDIVNHIEF